MLEVTDCKSLTSADSPFILSGHLVVQNGQVVICIAEFQFRCNHLLSAKFVIVVILIVAYLASAQLLYEAVLLEIVRQGGVVVIVVVLHAVLLARGDMKTALTDGKRLVLNAYAGHGAISFRVCSTEMPAFACQFVEFSRLGARL